MNIEGKAIIGAPQERVWDILMDVDQFAACLPGVDNVNKLDGRTFTGSVSAKIGPMSGRFAFTAVILESRPPNEMTASVDGTDSVTRSTMRSEIAMTLKPFSAAGTELSYRATVDIKGRMALLGDMVFRAAGSVMLEEFTKRLKERVDAAAGV